MEKRRPKIPTDKQCSMCYEYGNFECGRCFKVKYCSKECQKLDWKIHKETCQSSQIRAARPIIQDFQHHKTTLITCQSTEGKASQTLRVIKSLEEEGKLNNADKIMIGRNGLL